MDGGRRTFIVGLLAAVLTSGDAAAKTRGRARGTRRRTRTSLPSFERGAAGGSCPCNGNNVCVGPRGGRYCITRSGNKRYGV